MRIVKKLGKIAIITLVISNLFVGCNSMMDKVYDDNEKIANKSDSYSINGFKSNIESNEYSGVFDLSGSLTVWNYDSYSECKIEMPYKFDVSSGNAKLVLIGPDNNVITLVEIADGEECKILVNEDESYNEGNKLILKLKEGNYRIKVIGKGDANINMELACDKGDFVVD